MLTLKELTPFLGWCVLLNYGVLCLWFLLFTCGRDFILSWHRRWFRLSDEQFDAIHYLGMAIYKLAVFIFNLMPYLALKILY